MREGSILFVVLFLKVCYLPLSVVIQGVSSSSCNTGSYSSSTRCLFQEEQENNDFLQ